MAKKKTEKKESALKVTETQYISLAVQESPGEIWDIKLGYDETEEEKNDSKVSIRTPCGESTTVERVFLKKLCELLLARL